MANFGLGQFRPDVKIEQVTKYSSQRLMGTLHTKSLNGARFVQNGFLGDVYYSLNDSPFLFKEGASVSAKILDDFIKELEELKSTLEAMDLANKLSQG